MKRCVQWELVGKRKFVLLTVHLPSAVFITYLGVMIGTYYYSYLFIYPLRFIVFFVIGIPLIYFLYAHNTHRRLQPWCEKCRNGGQEVEVKEPDKPLPKALV
jgi:uncharacterized membrane protein